MSDKKISQLDPIVTSANEDLVVLVDVSTGETKRQTKENLLKEVQAAIDEHVGDTSNPHGVTAAQIGAYSQAEVDGLIDALAALIPEAWVRDYTPPQAVNGANTVFTIPQSASQVVVYADGMRVKGGGLDYTHNDDTITFAADRQPFAALSVDYLPS